jgi:hypothetical protein
MGLFRSIRNAIHVPPIIQKINPISTIVHEAQHIISNPIETIKNPIKTVSSIVPAIALTKEITQSVSISSIIQQAKEKVMLPAVAIAKKSEDLAKVIVHESVDVAKKSVSVTEKAVVGTVHQAESLVKGVTHGVGGLFGDIKWIIIGVVGITAIVVVMKGKEFINELKK